MRRGRPGAGDGGKSSPAPGSLSVPLNALTRGQGDRHALPPLAWLVHHPAVVEQDGDRVHRWGCPRLQGLARMVRRDGVLHRDRAPMLCGSCRPDVEMRLSAPRKR